VFKKNINFLSVGIDLGTSACRVAVLNGSGQVLHLSRSELPEPLSEGTHCEQSPDDWWQACQHALTDALSYVDKSKVMRIAVDATSSTLLLCDRKGKAASPALMYRDQRSHIQAERLSQLAPATAAVHSASSSLAKLLWFKDNGYHSEGLLALHQADWISGQLRGKFNSSDENNALKLGYDAINRRWPDWLALCHLPPHCLPEVLPAGQSLGSIANHIAKQFGLPVTCQVIAGTTDSTASFIASGASMVGDALTVLGSSLVVKILSDKPIFAPEMGVYSHRLGNHWLVGGASNTGGAVLKQFFDVEQIEVLSRKMNPAQPTQFDYMPLPATGERFPINNKDLKANFEPRPENDVDFLQAILESIAKIERHAYQVLAELGAPTPNSIRTCGGGAKNKAWGSIRQQILRYPLLASDHDEAAVGTAMLAASTQAD